MRSKELIKLAEQQGWSRDRQRGSHIILTKKGRQPVSIPQHNKDLGKGILHKLAKELGLKL